MWPICNPRTLKLILSPFFLSLVNDNAAVARKATSTKNPSEEGGDASQPLLSCAICFEDTLNEKGSIVCGHSFCFTCIHTWSKTENTCPLCKKRFSSIDKVPPSFVIYIYIYMSPNGLFFFLFKVVVCPGGRASSKRKRSVPSSSLKRRIPVRRRNQVIIIVPYILGRVFAYI